MDSDDIIRPDFSAKHTLSIRSGGRRCSHRAVSVDETSRTVECSTCDAILDPFSVVLQFAKHERDFAWDQSSKRKQRELIEELKKEERRIKQRIASAKKRAEKEPSLASVKLVGALMKAVQEVYLLVPMDAVPDIYSLKALKEVRRLVELAGAEELKL